MPKFGRTAVRLAVLLAALMEIMPACAQGWNYWGQVFIESPNTVPGESQLATDGTNLYYATSVEGIYEASIESQYFSPMPMTGFPLWNASSNPNGFTVANIATSSQGRVVISGTPVSITITVSNGITGYNFSSTPALTNTQPVFYWWDATNQVWQAAAVSGKTYPYTVNVGNFTTAADGSLWTCSGFSPYVYHSTDGGMSYTAIDINAAVPANYFPIPCTGGETSFGRIFSIVAGWGNEVVIGTETGGYLQTTNNGQTWTSLDPNFTNTNSASPLGRIGNATVAGIDHHGYFLLENSEMSVCPAKANWTGVALIGFRPADGSYYNADYGFAGTFVPDRVFTAASSGLSYTYLNQNYLLQGGVYCTLDGVHWSQFNQGSALDLPFPDGYTNVEEAGGCITATGNTVYIGDGAIYSFDSTPVLPITNRPPVALPQNINAVQGVSANFILTGYDADGDALNFTLTSLPTNGTLTGTAPNVTYKSLHKFKGMDSLAFVVDDGMATSAPAWVNVAVNSSTDQPPAISASYSPTLPWYVVPTNLVLSATATAANGIQQVDFYDGGVQFAAVTNPPYIYTWTNPPIGDQALNVCAIDNAGAATWAQPLNLTILPVAPNLSIQQADATDVALSWPVQLDGFYVESAANVTGPWTLSPYPQLYFTNVQTATIPMSAGPFFRLSHP